MKFLYIFFSYRYVYTENIKKLLYRLFCIYINYYKKKYSEKSLYIIYFLYRNDCI